MTPRSQLIKGVGHNKEMRYDFQRFLFRDYSLLQIMLIIRKDKLVEPAERKRMPIALNHHEQMNKIHYLNRFAEASCAAFQKTLKHYG
jgi:hypothetical protein